jgi:uncharacterized zinc-type alcohol dehydrogenase-like protein
VIVSTDAEQMKPLPGTSTSCWTPFRCSTTSTLPRTLRFDGVHILVGLIEPVDPPVHAAKLVLGRKCWPVR